MQNSMQMKNISDTSNYLIVNNFIDIQKQKKSII